jgi:hypothetical protein
MPSSIAEFVTLIISYTWACINVTTYINPVFRTVLDSFATLSSLLSGAGLIPCEGLLNVLKSLNRPSIAWFEALSDFAPFHCWGIYIQILRKKGKKTLLYIGSGTSTIGGIRLRLLEYVRGKNLPCGIEDAIAKGYRIVHRAVLVRCPIPSPAQIPFVRLAMVAVEAAFSALFSAMPNRHTSYGLPGICPWNKHLLEYDGACTHSPLVDGVKGDFSLTPEQLQEIYDATQEKNRVYQQQYGLEKRAEASDA